jgi:hypothetical protein
MPRAPRYPNTQTPADRALWRKIKRQIRATRRRKKKLYGLSTYREVDLYIPRHFTRIARPLKQSGPRDKIILFPH